MMGNFTKALKERFIDQKEYLGNNKPINNIEPIVSVTVATYQHAPYIKECIEGILMQKTDFPFEIIIGEDESSDGTREICIEYAKKYPNKIRLFLRDRKLSQYYDEAGKFIGRFNGHWNRMSARGKYIAWCEGDDYWIDPLKLQKQVNFLENNSKYGLVYTASKILNQEKYQITDTISENKCSLDEILITNPIVALTACFRACLIPGYFNLFANNSFKNLVMGDYPMWIYIASKSKIKYINEITGVYRVLNNSASHSQDIIKELEFITNKKKISHIYCNLLKKNYLIKKIDKKFIIDKLYIHLKHNSLNLTDLENDIYLYNYFDFKILIIKKLINSSIGINMLKKYWKL